MVNYRTVRLYFELVYCITPLVPSNSACLASSLGNNKRSAVWIYRDVMVDRLLVDKTENPRFTPPRQATCRTAGLVMSWMLSRKTVRPNQGRNMFTRAMSSLEWGQTRFIRRYSNLTSREAICAFVCAILSSYYVLNPAPYGVISNKLTIKPDGLTRKSSFALETSSWKHLGGGSSRSSSSSGSSGSSGSSSSSGNGISSSSGNEISSSSGNEISSSSSKNNYGSQVYWRLVIDAARKSVPARPAGVVKKPHRFCPGFTTLLEILRWIIAFGAELMLLRHDGA